MEIIPAIDVYNGQCVRLKQGDFEERTSYDISPLSVAKDFAQSGATTIHVVDLCGAEKGVYSQLDLVINIQKETGLCVQTGGGLRDEKTIKMLLDAGLNRVVIGSLAIKEPKLVMTLIDDYGKGRFVIGLDVQEGSRSDVLIEGWQKQAGTNLWETTSQFSQYTDLRILSTVIDRDGMLEGADTEHYKACVKKFPQLKWQASGGVSTLSELMALSKTGVDSVIIGKAFYEGRFTLKAALTELQRC